MPLLMKFAAVLLWRNWLSADISPVRTDKRSSKAFCSYQKRIEPRDRPCFEVRDGEDISKVCRTECRPMRDKAVGVKMAALPPHELSQIEVELRLKRAESDATTPDPATNVREEIVGIIKGECDAVALEIGPQSTPIAGQCGLRGSGGFVRSVGLAEPAAESAAQTGIHAQRRLTIGRITPPPE